MKKLSLLFLLIGGIIVLAYGRIYWQEQITRMVYEVEQPTLDTLDVNMEHTKNLPQFNMAYTENLPQEVMNQIELAIDNQKPKS